jgi:hypothetical protein
MVCVSERPMWTKVRPPSDDLYTPTPGIDARKILASPVPIHSTSGLDGATARSPMLVEAWASKIEVHVAPLSSVCQTPLVAYPA